MIEGEVGVTDRVRRRDGDHSYLDIGCRKLLQELLPRLLDGGSGIDGVIDKEDGGSGGQLSHDVSWQRDVADANRCIRPTAAFIETALQKTKRVAHHKGQMLQQSMEEA